MRHHINSIAAASCRHLPIEQCTPCEHASSLGESWDGHDFSEEQKGLIKEQSISISANYGEEINCRGGIDDYVVIRELGRGGAGTVLLAAHTPMHSSADLVAIKVMKIEEESANLKGLHMELEVLSLVGAHPFLPQLRAHFASESYAFLVMDYCSGGDLNMLRQRQPDRRLSEAAIRFYAAELVLALEHLHALGIVYRDLKPENVLISDTGHVVLTDFDLSLHLTSVHNVTDQDTCSRCAANSADTQLTTSQANAATHAQAMHIGTVRRPNCFLHCFTAGSVVAPEAEDIDSASLARTKLRENTASVPTAMHQISWKACTTAKKHQDKVTEEQQHQRKASASAEVSAGRRRCRHFVGTEEYVAPEVIRGEGYSYAVDWWALGILLHELMMGRTPFKGIDRKRTFYNIVEQEVRLPGGAGDPLRDLIERLLAKQPRQRLARAEDVKAHAFFKGIQWELLQHIARPPVLPLNATPAITSSSESSEGWCLPSLESFLQAPTSPSSSSSSSSAICSSRKSHV